MFKVINLTPTLRYVPHRNTPASLDVGNYFCTNLAEVSWEESIKISFILLKTFTTIGRVNSDGKGPWGRYGCEEQGTKVHNITLGLQWPTTCQQKVRTLCGMAGLPKLCCKNLLTGPVIWQHITDIKKYVSSVSRSQNSEKVHLKS